VGVVVHVLSGCPHCLRATYLLDRRGVDYEVVNGDGVAGFRDRLSEVTGGRTVPQIVIGDRSIGGADQLARLDRGGVLEALLADAPFPVVRACRRRWAWGQARWAAEARDASGRRVARGTGAEERYAQP
jgi:glutaredoxin 3